MLLLVVYQLYGDVATDSTACILLTSSMWFLVITWLFAPFLFNPSGFEWQKIVDDWTKWISSRGGIGVPANKAWESWWEEEREHLQSTGLLGRGIILSLRFFIFQYGIMYHLNISAGNKSISVSYLFHLSFLLQRVHRTQGLVDKPLEYSSHNYFCCLEALSNAIIVAVH
jgi:callose synthase